MDREDKEVLKIATLGMIPFVVTVAVLLVIGGRIDRRQDRDAFNSGRECGSTGLSVIANPHTGNLGEAWLRGWMSGKEPAP